MKKSKRKKKSNSWKIKQHRDQFFKKSKILGYRSRASFKLIELNSKFKIIKKNSYLLDLGAYPGGWSQVASKIITKGRILSLDIKPMKPIKNIKFLKCDIFDENIKTKIINFFQDKLDAVISDMAANTTGNKTLDANNTGELCIEAMFFAKSMLSKNGHFVSKFFMGSAVNEILSSARKNFKIVKVFKPSASRSESKENFIICKDPK